MPSVLCQNVEMPTPAMASFSPNALRSSPERFIDDASRQVEQRVGVDLGTAVGRGLDAGISAANAVPWMSRARWSNSSARTEVVPTSRARTNGRVGVALRDGRHGRYLSVSQD